MKKMVKFQTAAEIADDAAILATIMDEMITLSARSIPTAADVLKVADWLSEIVNHVHDAVPDFSIRLKFGGMGISSRSVLLLLTDSFDQLSSTVEQSIGWEGDTEELRHIAAGAYVSAALSAKAVLASAAFGPGMLYLLRDMEEQRRKSEQCDPSLPVR